jgi:putative transposase
MPNHYHLLLTPRVEGGVTKFMQKLNMGYAKYFNQKYERVGALFQGRFKSVPVVHEAHFLHLPFYIHFNPLDLFLPSWRERKIKDYQSALDFLGSYRWSSHLDYFGKKNFPSVTNRELLLDFFEGIEGYQKRTKEWLQEIDLELLKGRTLE